MHRSKFPKPHSFLAVPALAVALAGCGGAGGSKPTGQIAAKVNKGEVSMHQVQYVLQRQPQLASQRSEVAPRLVLESLVEQELAAQAARDQGIENEPAFVQGMEAARRELLARLYQERLAAKAALPSSDEVDRYYDTHPALFAERRLYTLQEFAVRAPAEGQAALEQLAQSSRSAVELKAALERSGLTYRTGVTVQAAEKVPMRLLDQLARLEEGRTLVHSVAGDNVQLWTLLKTQDAPVDRRDARPMIETYLVTERRRQAVTSGMGELRKAAQITYSGTFASATSAPAAR